MINQSDQFTQICPSAQVDSSLQPGMVMILSAYLNELDATAKMVNDGLVTVGLPPFDGNIKLSTCGHDPKRSIFAGSFVDLREPGLFLIGQVDITLEKGRFN